LPARYAPWFHSMPDCQCCATKFVRFITRVPIDELSSVIGGSEKSYLEFLSAKICGCPLSLCEPDSWHLKFVTFFFLIYLLFKMYKNQCQDPTLWAKCWVYPDKLSGTKCNPCIYLVVVIGCTQNQISFKYQCQVSGMASEATCIDFFYIFFVCRFKKLFQKLPLVPSPDENCYETYYWVHFIKLICPQASMYQFYTPVHSYNVDQQKFH
jgi:hypothetical protein